MYRKNVLNQLKETFNILFDDYKDELSLHEIFNMSKEYEIGTWKEQIEDYKSNSDEIDFDIKDAIKLCKTMIKELSKIKITDIVNQ
jgi:hypothetical protein